jgi:hypothetical protein
MVPTLKAHHYSNRTNISYKMKDQVSYLTEVPILRQSRVKLSTLLFNVSLSNISPLSIITFLQDSCSPSNHVNQIVNYCTDDYSVMNAESANHAPAWSSYNSSSKPSAANYDWYHAFQYTNADSISSYPMSGVYNTYLGGGYVYKMNGNASQIAGDLAQLQKNDWIDRNTRAVIIEFSAYNPNVRLFVYSYILFEILPTGSLVKSYRFHPITLFDFATNVFSFGTLCSIIYMLFILAMTFKQICLIAKHKLKYLNRFWTYTDLTLITVSYVAMSVYFSRLYETDRLVHYYSLRSSKRPFVNFQMLAYWNDVLSYFLAFCATIGSFEFFKILRHNTNINQVLRTIRHSCFHLATFGFLFAIVIVAFATNMVVVFGAYLDACSSFVHSAETVFKMMLGKYGLNQMYDSSPIMSIVIYFSFVFIVNFVLLRLFISILMTAFKDIRKKGDDATVGLNFTEYVTGKAQLYYKRFRRSGLFRMNRRFKNAVVAVKQSRRMSRFSDEMKKNVRRRSERISMANALDYVDTIDRMQHLAKRMSFFGEHVSRVLCSF